IFVWDRVRSLRDLGVTIVLTTHDMDEAAALADRVGIVDHGRLLALDTPAALTALVPGCATLLLTVERTGGDWRVELLRAALADLAGVERVEAVAASGSRTRYRLYCAAAATSVLGPAAQVVESAGTALLDTSLSSPSLEDVFIHLTGRDLRS